MTEPAVKRRVLTKVRRQFLHKRPLDANDDDVNPQTELLATPEQLNNDATRMLAPALGLVETNRTIYAGSQFLNSNCKISTIKVDSHLECRKVVLTLQIDENEILPWEYCVKRLESYGNLELATWANRIKLYHENHPKVMEGFLAMMNSDDPTTSAALAAVKAQNNLTRQELEKNFVFKMTMFASKDRIRPVSVAYGEGLLRKMGHSVGSFVESVKENGIPKLFDGDSPLYMELSKKHLDPTLYEPDYFQEGLGYSVQLYDKEQNKKEIKVRMVPSIEPTPEGLFGYVYLIGTDEVELNTENSELNSENYNGAEIRGCGDRKLKNVKKEDLGSSSNWNEAREAVGEDEVDSESDL